MELCFFSSMSFWFLISRGNLALSGTITMEYIQININISLILVHSPQPSRELGSWWAFMMLRSSMVFRKGGLTKAETCSAHTTAGHLMGADLVLGSLRLHLKVLKLVLLSLQELALQGFLLCSLKACSLFGRMRMAGKEHVPPSLPGDWFTSDVQSVWIFLYRFKYWSWGYMFVMIS